MRPEEGVMQSRAQAMGALLELITDQPLDHLQWVSFPGGAQTPRPRRRTFI